MRYIKMFEDNRPQMILAITDYDEVMDYLLDALMDVVDAVEREYFMGMIQKHQEFKDIVVIPPESELLDYDENIMGEPFFDV